jgi:hypothetical protein
MAGIGYYRGPYMQRGTGIGSIFSGLFRGVLPALASGVRSIFAHPATRAIGKSVSDAAITGGLNLAADAVAGRGMKKSFEKQLGEARKKVAGALRQQVPTLEERATTSSIANNKRKAASRGISSAAKRRAAPSFGGRKKVSIFDRKKRYVDVDDDDEGDEDDD